MKITDAWIDDPTLDGHLRAPKLVVEVDEFPTVTIEPETFSGNWTVGKYGPFVKYVGPAGSTAGEFNVRFRNHFPPIVDIMLIVSEDGTENEYSGYSLPLSRARQLVRKNDANWRLLISDRDAEKGTFLWLPVETDPSCRVVMANKKPCGTRPAKMIRVLDVDLSMCEAHIKEHNAKQARKRTPARGS